MRRLILISATILLAAGTGVPLAAQTLPTNDPALRRIWTVAMDSSQTEPLAQQLLDSVGPRLTGTPGAKRGNDWLVKTYADWGISAQNERYGTWRGWRRGYSHIDLVAPRVRTLEGTMLAYSPGTGGQDLTATTVILPRFGDNAAFVRWLPQARDRLVLVAPAQPTCRPRDSWEENATETSRERMDSLRRAVQQGWTGGDVRGTGFSLAIGTGELGLRLEAAGAAGVITSRPKDAWGTIEVFETYNTRAPAIALSCEDYGLVFRLTENGQNPRITLDLDAEFLGEQPVFNTIATVPGSERPDEYVVLSAHFDSRDGSSGATDNGTGTLTVLEAMRILRLVYPNPKRTIVAGHWIGEEVGLVGSRAYSEDHPEIVRGMQALFNLDSGTGRIVRASGGGLPNAAEHLGQWLSQLPDVFKEQIDFAGVGRPAGGGSDSASFACWGAPAFNLGALGWDYGEYTWHTNRDTYDKVVFDDLKGNATLVAMLTYLASEDSAFITRERAVPGTANGGGGGDSWPTCSAAPRSTSPRLR
jgi:carboxypeptidase Q